MSLCAEMCAAPYQRRSLRAGPPPALLTAGSCRGAANPCAVQIALRRKRVSLAVARSRSRRHRRCLTLLCVAAMRSDGASVDLEEELSNQRLDQWFAKHGSHKVGRAYHQGGQGGGLTCSLPAWCAWRGQAPRKAAGIRSGR